MDDLSSVGFEMVLYSFGSGWDLESEDPSFLPSLRADVAYANERGIEVGGYDLIALTRRWKSTELFSIVDVSTPLFNFAQGEVRVDGKELFPGRHRQRLLRLGVVRPHIQQGISRTPGPLCMCLFIEKNPKILFQFPLLDKILPLSRLPLSPAVSSHYFFLFLFPSPLPQKGGSRETTCRIF